MKKRDFILFLMSSAIIGISMSIDNAVFSNFLNDTLHVSVLQRTLLEIPREFPGFMVVFVSGALLFLGDVRIAAVANLFAAFGMIGIGYLSRNYGTMIAWLIMYSMGQHLYMPVSSNIGMNLSDSQNMGKRLGQINAANTAMFLLTSLATAYIFKQVKVNYKWAFIIGGVAYLISAVLIMMMTPHKEKKKSKKLIIRKEYTLFYILSIIYGARKQIFITFGPWVLIKVFEQGVTTFAILGFVIAGAGIIFKPMLGHLIDKYGEKIILRSEAAVLIFICLGYGFSKRLMEGIGKAEWALFIVCACFVIDQLLVAAGMARSTYLKKIAISPEDVSPTLSMGISMDHVVSMIIPFTGAFIWESIGYEFVFLGGACIALLNLFLTSKIRVDKRTELQSAEVFAD